MIPIDIPSLNKTLYFPENLAECDAQQYADMAKLLYMYQAKEISYFDLRVLAVYALLNLKKPKDLKNINENSLKWQNIYQLSELVDDFFYKDDRNETITIKLDFIHNNLPDYRIFTKYYGPEDGFQNVSFGQYVDGLEEYIYFHETGDVEALRLLFSIFYLPKGEIYNIETSRKRAKGILKYTDIRHLFGFYLFFTSMQHYILSGQLSVMGSEIDLAIIYQDIGNEKETKSTIPGIGIHSVIHDLAESGVFGNYKEVRATNMWTILLRLYELKKKAIDENNKSNESKGTP